MLYESNLYISEFFIIAIFKTLLFSISTQIYGRVREKFMGKVVEYSIGYSILINDE